MPISVAAALTCVGLSVHGNALTAPLYELAPRQRPAGQHASGRVDGMDLNDSLGQIDTYSKRAF